MCTARLRCRAPSAVPIGVARLPGHELRFHKIGRDGSGKCDAHRTGQARDIVRGVLFRLRDEDLAALDVAEDLGKGYERIEQDVETSTGVRRVMLYRALPDRIDPTLAPFDWYHAYVMRGAREHGMPRDYVQQIEAVTPMIDPDSPHVAAVSQELGKWTNAVGHRPDEPR